MTETRVNDIYRIALGSQPNIRAAELRISSADYGIKVAKGDRIPSLGAGANVFTGYSSARDRITLNTSTVDINQEVVINDPPFNGNSYTVIFKDQPFTERVTSAFPYPDQVWENRNFGFGLNLNVPIYNRGFVTNNIQQAEIAMQQAKYNAQLQKQNLKQTIQQAYLDLKAGYSTFKATQKQIDALELTFSNTEKQFNLGILNSVDYLQAKNNLARAKNDLVRAKYDYIFRSKILDFYNGETITLD
jgi:outer membrane protein